MKVDVIIRYAGEERVFENLEFTPPMSDPYETVSDAVFHHFHYNYDLIVLDSLTKEEF